MLSAEARRSRSSQGRDVGRPDADPEAIARIRGLFEAPGLLHPVYQPILALATGTVVGYEGFSRFGSVPRRRPDAWFAEAGRVGMGAELQGLAIARIIAPLEASPLPDGAVLTLNVSPRYLVDGGVASAIDLAEPDRLVIELTEEEPVRDYAALRRAMAPYLARGIRFGVDDAGAGFASMRHVIELQPAFVKLDATLIRGIESRRTLRAFLHSIHGFAVEIGATLVAEGVERITDLVALTETGFPLLAQGYAIARPGSPWPGPSGAAIRAWRGARTTGD